MSSDSTAAPYSADLSRHNVEHCKLLDLPPSAYYVPDFITAEEEEYLLKKIEQTPRPKWKTVGSGRRLHYWGGTLSKSGVLLPEALPSFLTTFPDIIERIERFLGRIDGSSSDERGFLGVNQVLVNEYQPGQGISPHGDGPAFAPLVATVSLGSHTVLDIYHYLSQSSPSPPMTTTPFETSEVFLEGRPVAAIPLAHVLLLPRSLFVVSSSLYTSHLHGIAARDVDVVQAKGRAGGEASVVANEGSLGKLDELLAQEGAITLARGTRTSLTFRRAVKTVKGGALLGRKQ